MPSIRSFGFPPFTRAVKALVYANVAIFIAMFILQQAAGGVYSKVLLLFGLLPTPRPCSTAGYGRSLLTPSSTSA